MAEQGFRSVKTSAPALRGSAVHLYNEGVFKGLNHDKALKRALKYIDKHVKDNEPYYTPDELEKIDLQRSLVIGICRGYAHQFQNQKLKIVGIEQMFRYPVRDLKGDFSVYAGTLDAIIESPKGYWVRDFKTKGFVHHMLAEWLSMDTQTLGYNWLLSHWIKEGWFGKDREKPVLGVVYDIAKISKVRQKQTQDLQAFHDELQEVYVRRADEYFISIPVKHTKKALKLFEQELYEEIQEIQSAVSRKRNTNSCLRPGMTCEYLPICTQGWTRMNKNLFRKDTTPYWDPKVSLDAELDL